MIYDVISGLVIGSPRSFRTQDLASSSSAKITSFIPLRFLRVPAQVSVRVPLRVARADMVCQQRFPFQPTSISHTKTSL